MALPPGGVPFTPPQQIGGQVNPPGHVIRAEDFPSGAFLGRGGSQTPIDRLSVVEWLSQFFGIRGQLPDMELNGAITPVVVLGSVFDTDGVPGEEVQVTATKPIPVEIAPGEGTTYWISHPLPSPWNQAQYNQGIRGTGFTFRAGAASNVVIERIGAMLWSTGNGTTNSFAPPYMNLGEVTGSPQGDPIYPIGSDATSGSTSSSQVEIRQTLSSTKDNFFGDDLGIVVPAVRSYNVGLWEDASGTPDASGLVLATEYDLPLNMPFRQGGIETIAGSFVSGSNTFQFPDGLLAFIIRLQWREF